MGLHNTCFDIYMSLKRCCWIRLGSHVNTHHGMMLFGRRSTSTNTNTSIEADAFLLTVKALIKWLIILGFVEGCVCGDDDGCIVAYASWFVSHERGHISVGKCIRTQHLASTVSTNVDEDTRNRPSCAAFSLCIGGGGCRVCYKPIHNTRATKALLILFNSGGKNSDEKDLRFNNKSDQCDMHSLAPTSVH